jgi:hypothetical protein
MPAEMFKVIASFQDASGKPLTGAGYQVKLRDKDPLFDDKLGVSSLDADGQAEFLVFAADIRSIDSPRERTPDLYFVLTKDGHEIFRSKVFPNVEFDTVDTVTGRPDSLTRTFGPFRVDV